MCKTPGDEDAATRAEEDRSHAHEHNGPPCASREEIDVTDSKEKE